MARYSPVESEVEPLAVFKFVLDLLPKGVSAARRGYRRLSFRWHERHPPLDEKKAFNAAFSVLGGQIEQCISFRSIDSNRPLIVVVRSAEHGVKEIHLLEKFGLTFRKIWSLEKIFGLRTLTVDDVDGDGNKEVVFEEASSGTGGGTRMLAVYSHSREQLAEISEWLYWANAAGPISPEVKVELKPTRADDQDFVAALEKYAVSSGFLKQTAVDFDDPEFATSRWHLENGDPKEGTIKLHFYRGRPRSGNSVSCHLLAGGVEWTGFFKGPIFGYLEDKDQHFIAYSPAWTYNWAISVSFCREALWFVRHNESESEARLYRFVFADEQGYLDSFPIPRNPTLLQTIESRADGILVNGNILMPFSEMQTGTTRP
jgi:hypothetical protein